MDPALVNLQASCPPISLGHKICDMDYCWPSWRRTQCITHPLRILNRNRFRFLVPRFNSPKPGVPVTQPYYQVPKGAQATQYVMRRVAPRRVWPPIAFGASLACWYEHITRTACLVICKNHRFWEFITRIVTMNRYTFPAKRFMATVLAHSTFEFKLNHLQLILDGTEIELRVLLQFPLSCIIVLNFLNYHPSIFWLIRHR